MVNGAPLYWATLGIGIAVNRMILEREPDLLPAPEEETVADGTNTTEHSTKHENASSKEVTIAASKGKKKKSRKERKAHN